MFWEEGQCDWLRIRRFSASSHYTDILDLAFAGTEPWQAKREVATMAEAFKVHNAASAEELASRRRVSRNSAKADGQCSLQRPRLPASVSQQSAGIRKLD